MKGRGLKKEFVVNTIVVPSNLSVLLEGAEIKNEQRVVHGKTRAEALSKAGIK